MHYLMMCSHKRLIDELSLLKKVREVDSRFPEYLQPAAQRSRKSDTFAYGDVAAAVPELGANFSTLIARMLKVPDPYAAVVSA